MGGRRARPSSSDAEFAEPITRALHAIDAAWQELAENGVDSAHFRYVHNTDEVPEIERYETDGHRARRCARRRSSRRPAAWSRAASTSTPTGPASRSSASAASSTPILMGCNTPIDENRASCASTSRAQASATTKVTTAWAEAFVNEVDKQVQEDKPIWEHKAYLVRPALADTDGPFMKFRKWASQFYVGDVDHGEQLVFPRRCGRTAWTTCRPRPPRRPASATDPRRSQRSARSSHLSVSGGVHAASSSKSRPGDEACSTSARCRGAMKRAVDGVVEEAQQRGVVAGGVEHRGRLVVDAELRPGDGLEELVERAEPTGQHHEGVGRVGHRRLPLVHGVDHPQLGEARRGPPLLLERGRDHAQHLAARGQHRVGQHPHQAHVAAAVDQAEPRDAGPCRAPRRPRRAPRRSPGLEPQNTATRRIVVIPAV